MQRSNKISFPINYNQAQAQGEGEGEKPIKFIDILISTFTNQESIYKEKLLKSNR